jgi:hypothetical protein
VIVVVEELVDETVIRADPNRTIIPGLIVNAVVVEPWGAHPSYVQGAYDRDNRFYLEWDPISRDEAAIQVWLREWVHGVEGREDYLEKLGAERQRPVRPDRLRAVRMSRSPAGATRRQGAWPARRYVGPAGRAGRVVPFDDLPWAIFVPRRFGQGPDGDPTAVGQARNRPRAIVAHHRRPHDAAAIQIMGRQTGNRPRAIVAEGRLGAGSNPLGGSAP